MTNKSNKYFYPAMVASISLIIMAGLAFYSYGYVHGSLVIPGNAMETLNNLVAHKGLFLSGIVGWGLIVVTDLLVTWALYSFLKDINRKGALLGGIFRLVYTVILAVAVANLFGAYQLIGDIAKATTSVANDVMASVLAFENIWSFGLIVFGVHLVMIGYVAYQSKFIPKILSVLLIFAGISYVLVHILHGVAPQLDSFTDTLEMILSFPMMVGELGFGVWLLIKGRKLQQLN